MSSSAYSRVMDPKQEIRLSRLEDEVARLRGERERLLLKMRNISHLAVVPDLPLPVQRQHSTQQKFDDLNLPSQRYLSHSCDKSSVKMKDAFHLTMVSEESCMRNLNRCFSSGPAVTSASSSRHPHVSVVHHPGVPGSLSSYHLPTYLQDAAVPMSSALHHRDVGDPLAVSSRCTDMMGGQTARNNYQMSQDLEDLQIKLIERKYGGGPRCHRAARTIQNAYRDYTLRRNFARLKQSTQTSHLTSGSHLTLLSAASSIAELNKNLPSTSSRPTPPTTSRTPVEGEDDVVLARAFCDWENTQPMDQMDPDNSGTDKSESQQLGRPGDPTSMQCESALESVFGVGSSESEGSSPMSITCPVPAMSLLTGIVVPEVPPPPPRRHLSAKSINSSSSTLTSVSQSNCSVNSASQSNCFANSGSQSNSSVNSSSQSQPSPGSVAGWEGPGCRDSGVSSASTSSSTAGSGNGAISAESQHTPGSMIPPPVPPHANQKVRQLKAQAGVPTQPCPLHPTAPQHPLQPGGVMTTSRDSGVDADCTPSPCSPHCPAPVTACPPRTLPTQVSRNQSGEDARRSVCSSESSSSSYCSTSCRSCSSTSTATSTGGGEDGALKASGSISSLTSSSTTSSQASCPAASSHHPLCQSARHLHPPSIASLATPSPIWKRKDGSPSPTAVHRALPPIPGQETPPSNHSTLTHTSIATKSQLPLSNLPASYHNLPRHQQTLPSHVPRIAKPPPYPSSDTHKGQSHSGHQCCQGNCGGNCTNTSATMRSVAIGSAATLDRHRITNDMRRKRLYRIGLNLFNKKPEKGIHFLIRHRFVENCPEMIAKFLMARKGLSRQMIGEYLGDTQTSMNIQVLHHFANDINMRGLEIDEAMRKFFSYFRLPGESQKIGHILEVFASVYLHCQVGESPGAFYTSQTERSRLVDTLYVLAYAVVMLNTDLHNANIKKEKKMRLDQFVKNLRGVDGGRDFDPGLLSRIYYRVRDRQFEPSPDHTTQVRRIAECLLHTPGMGAAGTLVQSHRRMVCFCRMQEIVDTSKKSKLGEHAREVFLFNDLLLVSKATPKKAKNVGRGAVVGGGKPSVTSGGSGAACSSATSSSSSLMSANVATGSTSLTSVSLNSTPSTGASTPSNTSLSSGAASTSSSGASAMVTMYTCKHAYSLVGVYAVLVDPQLYPYCVQLRRSMDNSVLVNLSAKTASDRQRFFEDIQECILEMSEMESMRIEEELVKQQRNTTNTSTANSPATETFGNLSTAMTGSYHHRILTPSSSHQQRKQHTAHQSSARYYDMEGLGGKDIPHSPGMVLATSSSDSKSSKSNTQQLITLPVSSSMQGIGVKNLATNGNVSDSHRMSGDSGLQMDL